jgi:hypothetical protein
VSSSATIVALIVAAAQPVDADGTIQGIVMNSSRGGEPVAGVDVVLRVQQDGGFVPIAQTAADDRGRFVFDGLPTDSDMLYLPGASHGGVHYPGPRLRWTPGQASAEVTLQVVDAITDPSPLVALRHDVVVRPDSGLLRVTESILVSNPSAGCYVGPPAENDRTVTLRLSIPPSFEKVTFHNEFFGRRFVLTNGKLVTNVPWPPGDRELQFTYFVPVTERRQTWERPLDLPCSRLSVRVVATNSNSVACSLGAATQADGEVMFDSGGGPLPAGHVVQLAIGGLKAPTMLRARWMALAVLGGLVALATGAALSRPRRASEQTPQSGAKVRAHRRSKPNRLHLDIRARTRQPSADSGSSQKY